MQTPLPCAAGEDEKNFWLCDTCTIIITVLIGRRPLLLVSLYCLSEEQVLLLDTQSFINRGAPTIITPHGVIWLRIKTKCQSTCATSPSELLPSLSEGGSAWLPTNPRLSSHLQV